MLAGRVPCVPPHAEDERQVFMAAVRELRTERGLTQEAVADRGELSRKYLGQLERGELVPRLPSIAGVARGLGMTTADFLRAYADRLDAAGE